MQNATSKLRIAKRRGGVYIAVLGTSLIVSLLAISALALQRVQNRMLTGASDIRQAQLNAESAVDLGLLTLKQNNNWRSLRDGQSYLFTNRGTDDGSACSLQTLDASSDAANAADRPAKILGIGSHGPVSGDALRISADQRIELIVDPLRQPHDCLRNGSTAVPDWNSVFSYYQANGTAIDINTLPNGHPVANFAAGRNPDMEANDDVNGDPPYWENDASGTGSADVDRSNNERHLGTYSLRVRDRSNWRSGASHSVKHFLKPETPYLVEAWVKANDYTTTSLTWHFTLRTKTLGNPAAAPVSQVATESLPGSGWLKLSATITSNDWSGELDYAWITVACDDVWTGIIILGGWDQPDFYMDDFLIKESTIGRFIYKQAIDANGIYWIDCQNQNLYIERSRLRGTLLVLNPGPNSRIDYGPINWKPHIPGYPALLVNGNFSIRATNQLLNEVGDDFNYNPSGPPAFPYNGSADGDKLDQYPSEIHGMVVVSGNLTYKYTPQIKGRVLVGGNGGAAVNLGTPTVTYLPDSLLNPPPPLGGFYSYRYDRRPASTRKAVLP
jgi:hypothetical protein